MGAAVVDHSAPTIPPMRPLMDGAVSNSLLAKVASPFSFVFTSVNLYSSTAIVLEISTGNFGVSIMACFMYLIL
mgnify:CR=1 FL=1